MTKPKISFCIPTYNRAERVYECVSHILSYKGNDIEVVVSNNASEDNTLELLGTISDSRLRVISNGENIAALNWPLALSRASGEWAALVSDEDVVIIDNIPYYIENFLNPEIGMIFFNFPPVVTAIDRTYICENQNESLYSVIMYGGHITGAVHNMSKLKISDIDSYLDYLYTPGKTMKFEPQQQLCMDNATYNKVMVTDIPICSFGRVEKIDNNAEQAIPSKRVYERIVQAYGGRFMVSGFEPAYRIHQIEAYASHISKNISNPPARLYYAALRNVTVTISRFYAKLLTQKSYERDEFFWDELRKVYSGYNRDTSVNELCGYFEEAIQCLSDTTKDSQWKRWFEPFKQCLKQKYSAPLPKNITPTESIIFGDVLFSVILPFYQNFNSAAVLPFDYFAADFNDLLGMKPREVMRSLMSKGNYKEVISFDAPDNIRTRYYKGLAYFHLDDIDKAEECFDYIIEKTRNPVVLDDIIINEIAVQYSLYYMGIILARKGKLEASEKYFEKCCKLSDELLIRANLASPSLPKIEGCD